MPDPTPPPPPPSNREGTPTEQDLRKLPRWARVAFAARCARRVMPVLYSGPDLRPEHRELLMRVLHAVEDAARGARWNGSLNDVAVVGSLLTAMEADKNAIDTGAAEAMHVLMAAGTVAAHTRNEKHMLAQMRGAVMSAWAAAQASGVPQWASVNTGEWLFPSEVWRDYNQLLALARAEGWTDDTPVDPDRLGPIDQSPDFSAVEIDARAYITDVNKSLMPMGIQLPESEDYDTVGGFVMVSLGRIPAKGETAALAGVGGEVVVEVLEATPTRVTRVRLSKTATVRIVPRVDFRFENPIDRARLEASVNTLLGGKQGSFVWRASPGRAGTLLSLDVPSAATADDVSNVEKLIREAFKGERVEQESSVHVVSEPIDSMNSTGASPDAMEAPKEEPHLLVVEFLASVSRPAVQEIISHGFKSIEGLHVFWVGNPNTPRQKIEVVIENATRRELDEIGEYLEAQFGRLMSSWSLSKVLDQRQTKPAGAPKRVAISINIPPMEDTPEHRAELIAHVREVILAANQLHLARGGGGLKVADARLLAPEPARVPAGGDS